MLQRDLLRAGGDRVDEYQETQPNKGVKTSGTLHGRAPGDVVICCGGVDRGREQAGAVVGVGLVAREEVRSSKHRLSKPEGSKRWRRPMYFNNLPLGQTAETKKSWGGPGNKGLDPAVRLAAGRRQSCRSYQTERRRHWSVSHSHHIFSPLSCGYRSLNNQGIGLHFAVDPARRCPKGVSIPCSIGRVYTR